MCSSRYPGMLLSCIVVPLMEGGVTDPTEPTSWNQQGQDELRSLVVVPVESCARAEDDTYRTILIGRDKLKLVLRLIEGMLMDSTRGDRPDD